MKKQLKKLAVDLSKVQMPTTLDKKTWEVKNEIYAEISKAEKDFRSTSLSILEIEEYVAEHLAKKGYRKVEQEEWIFGKPCEQAKQEVAMAMLEEFENSLEFLHQSANVTGDIMVYWKIFKEELKKKYIGEVTKNERE